MEDYVTYERSCALEDTLAERLLKAENTYDMIDVRYDFAREIKGELGAGDGLFVDAFGRGYLLGYKAAMRIAHAKLQELAFPKLPEGGE
jgi:hypothetical protein